MAKEASAPPSTLKGGRPPAVKSGGRRVSKKQENGAVEKNSKNSGKEKTRSASNFLQQQHRWPIKSHDQPWRRVYGPREFTLSNNLGNVKL
ncbi:death-associated protein-like 1 isoform X3 [Malaclemys terrapin pileata]|uniref:death-associated protein-like 1 isoform X3 n=1 Tax=Malaclemys terrapin pileata TaxID=2991368 RepID=UPI0023A90C17|nr:death-associated protein-like 1 isoform X3 [Malaclemys terrapin pileata]